MLPLACRSFHLAHAAFVSESGERKEKVQHSLQQGGLAQGPLPGWSDRVWRACGSSVSNGTETSTLLPLFSSGSSGALRGLLILACNGKCVAMLNPEPLFTAQ